VEYVNYNDGGNINILISGKGNTSNKEVSINRDKDKVVTNNRTPAVAATAIL
jgi:hypothetical protein